MFKNKLPAIFLITLLIFSFFFVKKVFKKISPQRPNVLINNSETNSNTNTVSLGFFLHPNDYRAGFQKDFTTYDSRATSITMNWSNLEPSKGNFHWQNLDTLVNLILSESPEIKILLHVRSQAPWAVVTPCEQFKEAEMPAKNIKDWENFIRELSTRYKGKISLYTLSNEAATPVNWGGCETNPSESYATMIRSMYSTVKKYDPVALITNDGISSGLLTYMYGYREIYANNKQNGVVYFREVVRHHAPGGFSIDPTEGSIQQIHDGIFGRYAEPFWDMLLENQDYFDVMSIHWYQPSKYLVDVMPWLQNQFPNKPLQLWETAYAWEQNKIPGQTYGNYSQQEQANETAKLLTIGAAYGGLAQLWPWTSIVEDQGKFPVGVVNLKTNPPTYKPAAIAYKLISEYLNGSSFVANPNLGSTVTVFQFQKDSSQIYIIWSERQQIVDLDLGDKSVKVIDLNNSTNMQPANKLSISNTPIIVVTQ